MKRNFRNFKNLYAAAMHTVGRTDLTLNLASGREFVYDVDCHSFAGVTRLHEFVCEEGCCFTHQFLFTTKLIPVRRQHIYIRGVNNCAVAPLLWSRRIGRNDRERKRMREEQIARTRMVEGDEARLQRGINIKRSVPDVQIFKIKCECDERKRDAFFVYVMSMWQCM